MMYYMCTDFQESAWKPLLASVYLSITSTNPFWLPHHVVSTKQEEQWNKEGSTKSLLPEVRSKVILHVCLRKPSAPALRSVWQTRYSSFIIVGVLSPILRLPWATSMKMHFLSELQTQLLATPFIGIGGTKTQGWQWSWELTIQHNHFKTANICSKADPYNKIRLSKYHVQILPDHSSVYHSYISLLSVV